MSVQRYLATFAPGFEGIIESLLIQTIPSATGTEVSSGIVFFTFSGPTDELAAAAFFNNIFLIVNEWKTAQMPFDEMIKSVAKANRLASVAPSVAGLTGLSYRVRYSRENQFCPVDKKMMDAAEQYISRATGLKADRFDPGLEFWYIIRREGWSFFAIRLTKKPSTEKYLRQGELRPEIVQLIVGLARVSAQDRFLLDPFAGYGSIPEQLALITGKLGSGGNQAENGHSVAGGNQAVIHASDLDAERVTDLETRFTGNAAVTVGHCDALKLAHIADSSVDLIVTDPPWGFWEGSAYSGENSIEALYEKMLAEFARVLKIGSRAVVLTGAKREFEEAVGKSAVFARCAGNVAPADASGASGAGDSFRTDILVNGKKSAVFVLKR